VNKQKKAFLKKWGWRGVSEAGLAVININRGEKKL
jgi:hypothetical protein